MPCGWLIWTVSCRLSIEHANIRAASMSEIAALGAPAGTQNLCHHTFEVRKCLARSKPQHLHLIAAGLLLMWSDFRWSSSAPATSARCLHF